MILKITKFQELLSNWQIFEAIIVTKHYVSLLIFFTLQQKLDIIDASDHRLFWSICPWETQSSP